MAYLEVIILFNNFKQLNTSEKCNQCIHYILNILVIKIYNTKVIKIYNTKSNIIIYIETVVSQAAQSRGYNWQVRSPLEGINYYFLIF